MSPPSKLELMTRVFVSTISQLQQYTGATLHFNSSKSQASTTKVFTIVLLQQLFSLRQRLLGTVLKGKTKCWLKPKQMY